MTAGSLPWYAVNCVFAPRTAARQLMQEGDVRGSSFKLILLGIVATFLSLLLVNGGLLALAPQLLPEDMFLIGNTQTGVLLDAATFTVVSAFAALLSVFVVKYLFRYKTPEQGALAAAALVLALSVITGPLQELAYGFTASSVPAIQYPVYAGSLFLVLFFPVFYYSEIFSISNTRAFFLNACAVLVIVLGIVFIVLVAMLIYFAADSGLSGLVSWILT